MMTKSQTIVAGIIVAIIVIAGAFVGGYFMHAYRHQAQIANYNKNEQARTDQLRAIDAEQNKLRGENDGLRKQVAELSAIDEGLKAITANRGGVIAAEAKNLEAINHELQNDQAIIKNPADKCLRCRRFSDRAVARGQIGQPLTCKDECAGTNQ